uniref:Ribosomal protein S19 n=1 Tax=Romanomermis culicivorax TaxID=13658 RepID=A0A915KFT9_ROMCU
MMDLRRDTESGIERLVRSEKFSLFSQQIRLKHIRISTKSCGPVSRDYRLITKIVEIINVLQIQISSKMTVMRTMKMVKNHRKPIFDIAGEDFFRRRSTPHKIAGKKFPTKN